MEMNQPLMELGTPEEARAYALLGFMLTRLRRLEAIHETISAWRNFSEARKQACRVKMPNMVAERDAESGADPAHLIRMRNILAHGLYWVFPNGGVTIIDNKVASDRLEAKRAKQCGELGIDDTLSCLRDIRLYTMSLDRLEKLAQFIDECTSYDRLSEEAITELFSQPLTSEEEERLQTWISEMQAK